MHSTLSVYVAVFQKVIINVLLTKWENAFERNCEQTIQPISKLKYILWQSIRFEF